MPAAVSRRSGQLSACASHIDLLTSGRAFLFVADLRRLFDLRCRSGQQPHCSQSSVRWCRLKFCQVQRTRVRYLQGKHQFSRYKTPARAVCLHTCSGGLSHKSWIVSTIVKDRELPRSCKDYDATCLRAFYFAAMNARCHAFSPKEGGSTEITPQQYQSRQKNKKVAVI